MQWVDNRPGAVPTLMRVVGWFGALRVVGRSSARWLLPRALRRPPALALAALAFVLTIPANADASTQYVRVGEIPGFGLPLGGVAVDRSSGDLYAVDGSNAVVDKYSASGTLISSFGGPGSGNGQFGQGFFSGPCGIAVDQLTGDVYVVDTVNGRVEKFDSSGAYLSQFNGAATTAGSFSSPSSVAVDPASSDVYVADSGHDIVDKFDSSGNIITAFGNNGTLGGSATPASSFAFSTFGSQPPPGLAVDSTGRLYVGDTGNGVVDEFDSAGVYLGQLGAGSLTAPSELAVDASDDVFVADSSSQSVTKFDSGGSRLANFPTNNSNVLRGVAVGGDGAHVYVSTTSFAESSVLIFSLITLPDVATAGASNVDQTTATPEGTVNPDGVQLTECHFVYTDSADFQANGYSGPDAKAAACVPAVASIPPDHGEHVVTSDLTGLAPNTAYDFRLIAANANGTSHGQDRGFTTPGPPSVDRTSVTNVTETAAILKGEVNPENFHTTYRFEYGTSTAYGSNAPVPDGDLGSGPSDQLAITPITGLTPGTTYHFRIAAQSAQGTSRGSDHTFATYPTPTGSSGCPNERLREEDNSTALPDCRAYELVTPSQKQGNEVGLPKDEPDAAVTIDGAHVEYSTDTLGSFGDATNGLGGRFLATRGSGGWISTFVSMPTSPHPELSDTATPAGASRDLSRIFYEIGIPLDAADQNHVRDVYARNPDGSVSWVSQSGAVATAPISSEFAGASADGSHALFQTKQPLTAAAQPLLDGNELYDRVGENTDLVGVKADGSLTSVCGAIAGGGNFSQSGIDARAMSSDGSRIFFESPDPFASGDAACSPARGGTQPVELYVREGAATTTEISLSHKTGSSGTPAPEGATYKGASTDGARVFFTSPDLLTNDAAVQPGESEALYAYDVGGDTLKFIASGTPLTAPKSGGQPMISADGTHIYFLGSVPANGPGGENLYLWDEGRISYISSAPTTNSADVGGARDAQIASDGAALAFTAAQNLTGYDSQGHTEIYFYNAITESLVCISCDPTNSTPPSGQLTPDLGGSASNVADVLVRANQAITSDGHAVFFDTPVPLVPQDTNTGPNPSCQAFPSRNHSPGTGCDVYEYENGTVRLLSSGTGRPSRLIGVSSDGADVIINTSSPLVPQDQDGGYGNLFDVRVDGGFAFTPPVLPCGPENCRPPVTQPQPDPTPGSVTFLGPGDPVPTGPTPMSRIVVSHKMGTRTSLVLTVSIPSSGRLTIDGAGLKHLSRSLSKAASYRVVVYLAKRETRLLSRRRNVTLNAKVTFAPSAGGPSSTPVSVTVRA